MARLIAALLVLESGMLVGCDQSTSGGSTEGTLVAADQTNAISDPAATDLNNSGQTDPTTPPPEVDQGTDDGATENPPPSETTQPTVNPCEKVAKFLPCYTTKSYSGLVRVFTAPAGDTCEFTTEDNFIFSMSDMKYYGTDLPLYGLGDEWIYNRIDALEYENDSVKSFAFRQYHTDTGEMYNELVVFAVACPK